jgi:pimeloyl-ACP methyl ester carboxylesterase
VEVPSAVALFPADPPAGMRRDWVERSYSDLRRLSRMERGGHFPAMEEPELLAEDIRSFFRPSRQQPYLKPSIAPRFRCAL